MRRSRTASTRPWPGFMRRSRNGFGSPRVEPPSRGSRKNSQPRPVCRSCSRRRSSTSPSICSIPLGLPWRFSSLCPQGSTLQHRMEASGSAAVSIGRRRGTPGQSRLAVESKRGGSSPCGAMSSQIRESQRVDWALGSSSTPPPEPSRRSRRPGMGSRPLEAEAEPDIGHVAADEHSPTPPAPHPESSEFTLGERSTRMDGCGTTSRPSFSTSKRGKRPWGTSPFAWVRC